MAPVTPNKSLQRTFVPQPILLSQMVCASSAAELRRSAPGTNLPTLTESFFYFPALVNPKRVNEHWQKHSLFLDTWNQPPREKWFINEYGGNRMGFIADLAGMDDDESIGFTNGRHRTRWLLEIGIKAPYVFLRKNLNNGWQQTLY